MPDPEPSPPFFILGAPRSGTTLISSILSSHSRLAVYIESNYYPFFRPHLRRYGDLARPENLRRFVSDVGEIIRTQGRMEVPAPEEFLEDLVAPTFEGVFATVLRLHARQQGKIRGGEKTPGHHMYLPEILERFPDSPVIFVMRDPRDVVSSLRQAFGASLEGAAWTWNQAFLSYQKSGAHTHLVRYEEFVQDPAARSAALCAALREPYEAAVLRFFEQARKTSRPVPLHHQKILEPIDATPVGRFARMPRREIEWIESACAAGMEALGYEFTSGRPHPRPVARPGRLVGVSDQVRFYGVNRTRWWRAATRWKIVLRVRARYLLSSVRGLFQ
jgi:hypothetical protein